MQQHRHDEKVRTHIPCTKMPSDFSCRLNVINMLKLTYIHIQTYTYVIIQTRSLFVPLLLCSKIGRHTNLLIFSYLPQRLIGELICCILFAFAGGFAPFFFFVHALTDDYTNIHNEHIYAEYIVFHNITIISGWSKHFSNYYLL